MADKMLFAPLLFLIVLIWPTIIIPVTSNEACVYDNAVATLTGRSCRNRRCTIEENNCRGNRECLCDGACGYRCISTVVSYCRELEPPVNGSIEYLDGNRAFGARAAYECDHGYLLSGEDEVRTCLGEREWSAGETPRCISQGELCPRREGVDRECQQSCTRRKDCLNKHEEGCLCDGDCGMSCLRVFVDEYCPPVELSEGAVVLFMTTKKIVYRSKVMLGCENQYKIAEGNVNITCLLNRTWSGRPLRCTPKALCTSPPVIEGARHDSWEHRFYAGDELLYTCKPGYYTYGLGQTSTCRDDGQWTNVTLECYPKSCGDPGYLRNGRREGNLFTFLSRVTFHCNIGYEMRGYAHRTCMSDQRWSSFMPECVAIECPRLYAPEFGSLEGTRVTYGSEAYLECNRGYKLLGSEYRRCQANGTWSGEETTCRVITCPEPDTPDNGSKRSPRYGLDAITHFSCNSGYTLFGSSTTRCTADERWSEPTPECKGDCSVESSPRNGYFLHRYERYTEGQVVQHGTVIEVRCYRLYSLNSEEPYECIDGEWSFDAECVEDPCPKLSELLNGQITYDPELVNQSQSTVPHETVATYSCLYGFEQQGGYSTTRCYFGAWNGRWEPVCEPKTCSKETLENGNVRYTKNDQDFSVRDQDPHHDVVRTARCSNGYSWEPSSRRQSVCENGEWSDSLPTCKPDACSTPDVDGGDIDVQSMRHGGTAQLTCRWNLKSSVGDGQLQCHAGHWVPDGIECINRDAPFNVAYGKPASQSPISEVSSRKQAPLAVDGDRTTDKNHGSCTVAKKSTQQVFWEVDLQNTYKIEYVVIYTKSKSQVRGATVQVGYSGMARQSYRQCGQEVNRRTVAVPESGLRVDCTSQLIAGQIVRIERQADSMSLCEVEVFVTGPVATCRIPDIAGMRQTLAGTNEELHAGTRVPPGTAIDYSCEGESYQHNGVRDNHCNSDGTWANTNPSCDAADCEVQAPENGWLLQQISRLPHGYQLAYSCRDRYEKAQDIVTHCESGELTPEPRCVPEHCRLQASDFGDVIINNNELAPDAYGIIHIPHGTEVHFTCARGHNLINQNRNTPRCWMGNLQDITHIPYCSPVTCDYPPYPQHGSYNLEQGDSAVHGSAIRYECYKGYQLQDPSKEYSYCVDGRWSPEELPVCQRLTVPVTETPNANAPCPTPSPPNALVFHNGLNIALLDYVINYGPGDWIVIRCVDRYSANGRKVVNSMCLNGAWTPALPSCEATFQKRSCSRPTTIPHVRQYVDGLVKLPDSLRTVFHHNSYMISRCVDPLKKKLMTGALRMCNDGQWDGPVPRCESAAISFAIPSLYTMLHQFLANGTLLIYPRVGELTIQCIVSGGKSSLRASHSEGFTPIENGKRFGRPIESHSGIYTCLKAGSEDYHLLSIQVRAVSCGEPLPPLNGRRIGNEFHLSQTVSFECNEGYSLLGESQIKCNAGEWLGEIPRCKARACPEIHMEELDPNLRLKVDGGTSQGSVLAFSCILGFYSVGETFLTCQGGRWSHPFPTCQANDEDVLDTGPLLTPGTCNCEVWQRCVPNSYGQWTCNCINPRQCDDTTSQQQYCGSDGHTYASICRLKATACLLDLDIQVASQGPCPEKEVFTPGPHDCRCEVWEKCVVESVGQWTCKCIHPRQCEDVAGQQEYCGSDGRTYASICKLKATACIQERDIEIASNGSCAGENPEELSSYIESSYENSEYSVVTEDSHGASNATEDSASEDHVVYCRDCPNPDLRTVCENSTHAFAGVPTRVHSSPSGSLVYSLRVENGIKGLNHSNVTVSIQGTFNEVNQCHCPRITLRHDVYLFVWRQVDSTADFQISGGFVGLWSDNEGGYHEMC